MSRDHTVLLWCTAYNLWTFPWVVHFELLFKLKGTEQIYTEGYFPSILISALCPEHLRKSLSKYLSKEINKIDSE